MWAHLPELSVPSGCKKVITGLPYHVYLWSLVHDCPELAQRLHLLEEFREAHWLDHIAICSKLVAFGDVRALARGGKHYQRPAPQARVGLDLAQHLEAGRL